MNALISKKEQDILRTFIPWNTLPSARFEEICADLQVEECDKGTVLFEQGDDSKEFVYLISGMISLFAGEMEMETIVTGSEAARFAIAHHIPRKVKAETRSKARIVRLPTHKLDMEDPQDSGSSYAVDEAEDQGGDWMTTMLQSPVFQRLPASNLQKVMMQMEEISFEAGEVVVKQGDEADYYYIIKSGDCELIRQASEGARPVKLAELHSCEAFGEDALLSGNPRNVTVQMKGKGQMLRLSKKNFISLVKEPVLQYVSFDEGLQRVGEGANWLDVRSPDVYAEQHIDDSVNIPFFSLRMKVAELRHDQLQVLVCEKGRTSEAAAFLLLKFGFNALILKGGMEGQVKQKSPATPKVVAKPEVTTSAVEQPIPAALDDEALIKPAQSELETRFAEVSDKLATAEQESVNLQQKLSAQEKMSAELEGETSALNEQLQTAQAEVEKREFGFDEALKVEQEQLALLKAELEARQIELEQAQLQASTDAQLSSDMTAQLEQSKQTAEAHLVEKDTQIKALDEQLSELNKQLVTREEAASTVEAQLQAKLQTLESTMSSNEASSSQLLTDLELKQLEFTEQSERLAGLEAEISVFANDREQQTSVLRDQESELDKLAQQLNQLNVELASSQEKQAGLESSLTTAQQAGAESASQLTDVVAECDGLKQSLAAAEGSANSELEERARLTTQLAEAEQKGVALQVELETVAASADESAELTLQLQARLDEGDESLQLLKRGADKIQGELEHAEAALSELAASKEGVTDELTQQLTGLRSELAQAASATGEAEQRLSELNIQLEQAQAGSIAAEQSSNEQLLELQGQLASGLDAQEQLTAELGQLRVALEEISQEREVERLQLTTSLEQAAEANRALDSSLSEQQQRFSDAESTQAEQASTLEQALDTAKADHQTLEEKLSEAVTAKDGVQQQLLELQDQFASGVDGQEQLTTELGQLRAELEKSSQEREVERLQLTASLEQAAEANRKLDSSLNEQHKRFSDAESTHAEQGARLEQALDAAKSDHQTLDEKLSEAVTAKEGAQQQLFELQEQLASGVDGQEQLTAQLGQLRAKLEESSQEREVERLQLTASLEQAAEANRELDSSLNEQQKRFSDAESTSTEQSAVLEQALDAAKVDHKSLDDKLSEAVTAKEGAQQQLLELQDQLASGVDGQEQLTAQLGQLRVELEESSQEREVERLQLTASLEQAAEANRVLDSSLSEQQQRFSDAESTQAEQASALEQALDTAKTDYIALDDKLSEAVTAKEGAQQKLLELQDQLASGEDGQEQLLAQLKQGQDELSELTRRTEEARAVMQGSLQAAEARCSDLEAAATNQLSENGASGKRVVELEQTLHEVQASRLKLDEELSVLQADKEGLQVKVTDAEAETLSANDKQAALREELAQLKEAAQSVIPAEQEQGVQQALEVAEQRYNELSESFDSLSAERLSEDKLFKRQLIDWDAKLQSSEDARLELEGVLDRFKVEQEKEGEPDEGLRLKLAELESSLEQAQQQSAEDSRKAAEAISAKQAIEGQLGEFNAEKEELQKNLRNAEKLAASAAEDDTNDKRVLELESQLDTATTQLLDLEIKLETSSAETVDGPSDEESNELAALKSELDLVREQTEKDVVAMQVKLESSEKMNLALKKKILSMQVIANEEAIVPEEEPTGKKGWWKKK